MNMSGHQLLAGSGFPGDKNGRFGRRDLVRKRD
jgi:hypothetical protein